MFPNYELVSKSMRRYDLVGFQKFPKTCQEHPSHTLKILNKKIIKIDQIDAEFESYGFLFVNEHSLQRTYQLFQVEPSNLSYIIEYAQQLIMMGNISEGIDLFEGYLIKPSFDYIIKIIPPLLRLFVLLIFLTFYHLIY